MNIQEKNIKKFLIQKKENFFLFVFNFFLLFYMPFIFLHNRPYGKTDKIKTLHENATKKCFKTRLNSLKLPFFFHADVSLLKSAKSTIFYIEIFVAPLVFRFNPCNFLTNPTDFSENLRTVTAKTKEI